MPNLNNLKFRQPKFVTPKSPAPWDVAAALAELEKDAFNALVKEPAEATGLPVLPQIPGPATLLSMVTVPLQGMAGQVTQGAGGGGGGTTTTTAAARTQGGQGQGGQVPQTRRGEA